jgi:hypothetical protein
MAVGQGVAQSRFPNMTQLDVVAVVRALGAAGTIVRFQTIPPEPGGVS